MLESKNIYILGYSGHAYVIVESALSNNHNILGYFDTKTNEENPYKLGYFGNENDVNFSKLIADDYVFPAVGDIRLRRKLIDLIEWNHAKQLCIIDRTAKVSKSAFVNVSTYVSSSAIINSLAMVGKGCVINSGAIVEHECRVEDFSHLAPGAVLLGNVKVGTNSFIGANSVVKEGVSIGDNVIIGAGAVVLKDIPDGSTWVGNPAKKIK